jgi:tetratricopeptide (TPR) repeat protein
MKQLFRVSSTSPLAAVLLLLLGVVAARTAQGQAAESAGASPSHGRRLAFVIGNDAYPQAPLVNAVNDAAAIGKAMEARGFDVTLRTNVSLRDLADSIATFVASVRRDDVVLLYYSGHGIQIEGDNYMVPIDFVASSESDAKYRGYSVNQLLDAVNDRRPALNVLVLDACRNNPFGATRSPQKGWAVMQGAFGNFIAFATSPGSTASDNPAGRNGLFTEQLIQSLEQSPSLTLDELFNRVRAQVYSKSRARQLPWSSSSVIGVFVFGEPLTNSASRVAGREGATTAIQIPAIRSSGTGERALAPQWQRDFAGGSSAPMDPTASAGGDGANPFSLLYAQNYTDAIRLLASSLSLPEARSDALRLRALAYAGIGSQMEARSDLVAALKEDKVGEYLTHHVGCIVSVQFGQYDAALAEARVAIAIRGDYGDAHLCLAAAYYGLGRYSEALQAYSRASALQPPCVQCELFHREIERSGKQ